MHAKRLSRRLTAERTGSPLLAATVVRSGITAKRLAGGDFAGALLANSAAPVAGDEPLVPLGLRNPDR